jgi:cell division inhibitor SepF
MAKLFNKVLNFVGWEAEDEEDFEEHEEIKDSVQQPQFLQPALKKQQSKVVNIHTSSQFKVVVMQPENLKTQRIFAII